VLSGQAAREEELDRDIALLRAERDRIRDVTRASLMGEMQSQVERADVLYGRLAAAERALRKIADHDTFGTRDQPLLVQIARGYFSGVEFASGAAADRAAGQGTTLAATTAPASTRGEGVTASKSPGFPTSRCETGAGHFQVMSEERIRLWFCDDESPPHYRCGACDAVGETWDSVTHFLGRDNDGPCPVLVLRAQAAQPARRVLRRGWLGIYDGTPGCMILDSSFGVVGADRAVEVEVVAVERGEVEP
jgi:hypothetical protein